jgi:hypothetical protein
MVQFDREDKVQFYVQSDAHVNNFGPGNEENKVVLDLNLFCQ